VEKINEKASEKVTRVFSRSGNISQNGTLSRNGAEILSRGVWDGNSSEVIEKERNIKLKVVSGLPLRI
jgi:hypothetical protein